MWKLHLPKKNILCIILMGLMQISAFRIKKQTMVCTKLKSMEHMNCILRVYNSILKLGGCKIIWVLKYFPWIFYCRRDFLCIINEINEMSAILMVDTHWCIHIQSGQSSNLIQRTAFFLFPSFLLCPFWLLEVGVGGKKL